MKNLQLLAPIAALICAAIVCGAVLLWAPVCSGTLELANGNMVPMRCTVYGEGRAAACPYPGCRGGGGAS